jgi:LysW-gamma-L-lysine carboxypeptidase
MSETATRTDADIDGRGLLQDLVSIPSPSGEEEAACLRLLEFFEEHGRDGYIDEVGNVRVPGNDVLVTSHIDTVPGDIPVRVENGELWGRGAVDATGPLVAMAVAAVETGASFAAVVGEEDDSRGARFLVEDRDAPEFLINGEPSGWDAITLGYRGFLKGTLTSMTASAHTSRPEPNALDHAIDFWHDVDAAFPDDQDESIFEQVTVTPTHMDGGVAEDGLAFEATMTCNIRVPPKVGADEVKTVVGQRVPEDAGFTWIDSIPPVMQDPRNPVAAALRAAIRGEGGQPGHLRKTGTADMNIYAAAWDCPMATYGPGDSNLDHAPDERIDLDEFDRATTVLEAACDRLSQP